MTSQTFKLSSDELEKKLRRIELKRLWMSSTNDFSIEEMRDTSEAFINYSIQTSDYRFLNAALKLNDRLKNEISAGALETLELKAKSCLEQIRRERAVYE